MELDRIHGHTVDLSLLNGNACIDVGCTDFKFSLAMKQLGQKVYSFDCENFTPPDGIAFMNVAISTKTGTIEENHITIDSIALNEIYDITGEVDVLKLACEGTEYALLSDHAFQPIPRQITVEFHEQSPIHNKMFPKCVDKLSKWYDLVYNSDENIDCLFVRR